MRFKIDNTDQYEDGSEDQFLQFVNNTFYQIESKKNLPKPLVDSLEIILNRLKDQVLGKVE